ncbi:MAG: hypothetical protein ACPGUC_06135 [Gammaproteobacteria bacterium]
MNRSALILFPRSLPPGGSVHALVPFLADLELLGDAFDYHGVVHHGAGEQFVEYVTFLGCIPHLVLDVEEGMREDSHAFVHLEVRESAGSGGWITSRNSLPPRCPTCRKPHRAWRESITEINADASADLECPHCASRTPVGCWNWKHHAGPDTVSIWVWGVFPSEGIPSPTLLSRLAELGWGDWDYFYRQS